MSRATRIDCLLAAALVLLCIAVPILLMLAGAR